MNDRAVLAPEAQRELRNAIRHIGRENLAAAETLRRAVEEIARRIGPRPLLGHVRPDLAPERYRFWSLTAFSMLLVYDTHTDPIEILRLVHTKRDLPKLLKDLKE